MQSNTLHSSLRWFGWCVVLLLVGAPLVLAQSTREGTAEEIIVRNNSGTMYQHKNYFITVISSVVGKKGIPNRVKIGDRVTVEDITITVNYIRVTRHLEDISYNDQILARKGEVTCALAESPEDFPDREDGKSRVWVHVKQCQPLR